MAARGRSIRGQRAIVDRRALDRALRQALERGSADSPAVRAAVLDLAKGVLADGRAEIKSRLEAGANGLETLRATSFLIDQLIRSLYDFAAGHVYPASNPSSSERMSLVAVGGYGRGELAPFSDIDILFLLPYKQTPWGEQIVEYLLYLLWDLGLKVGHATRSIDETLRQAKQDLTIRTAVLESRYIWGDQALFVELKERFQADIVAGSEPDYVEAKLAERDERHARLGDSRYLLEPNVKEGKGGLRDLQTLFWIAKYLYAVERPEELVERGVLTAAESKAFARALNFLTTVRCHLHTLTGRAEDRLTFDLQPELARRLGYTDHAGTSGVERFMKHYYLTAKEIGNLTRIFAASLEDQHKRRPRFRLPLMGPRQREIDGFQVDGGRIRLRDGERFADNPVDLIRLFQVSQARDLEIHPRTLQDITRNLRLIDKKLRRDAEANRLFLDILTSKRDPATTLRRMNEAGVFGRFVPDFGRVVAQMQHDMYHVYTVDEHTIRAIGILAKIESGDFAEDHPLSAEIIHQIGMRRVLYVAVLLHDIAKGRGGDHSILGEEVAQRLCPRFGMSPAETETVAWLVRWHLAMSSTAFKRDLDDPKTIDDFVALVQGPERLKLLLVLTVADIRAVGPTVWNGWKGQLLRELYGRVAARLLAGPDARDRISRVEELRQGLAARLSDWSEDDLDAHMARGSASFWRGGDLETHARWARLMRDADAGGDPVTIDARVHSFRSVTELTVYARDHPGLFSRLAGAIAASGASIVDARILTTNDGFALDVFWLQDLERRPVDDAGQLERLSDTIRRALAGEVHLAERLDKREGRLPRRAKVFQVEPLVLIDNSASNTHTVIEMNARDRPGLLFDVTRALYDLALVINHASIATYGERAVDVFYVKDVFGLKITGEGKLETVRERLLQALAGLDKDRKAMVAAE